MKCTKFKCRFLICSHLLSLLEINYASRNPKSQAKARATAYFIKHHQSKIEGKSNLFTYEQVLISFSRFLSQHKNLIAKYAVHHFKLTPIKICDWNCLAGILAYRPTGCSPTKKRITTKEHYWIKFFPYLKRPQEKWGLTD